MPDPTKSEAKPETVKVKVAPGRTIYHDGEIYHANQEFDAPKSDVALLIKNGFLPDPDAKEVPLPQGARVGLVSSERR